MVVSIHNLIRAVLLRFDPEGFEEFERFHEEMFEEQWKRLTGQVTPAFRGLEEYITFEELGDGDSGVSV